MMNVYQTFSQPVYVSNLELDTKRIVSLIDTTRPPVAVTESSTGKKSLHALNEDKFLDLKKTITKEIATFTNDILKYTNDFVITTSWFTKIKSKESSQFHNHRNSFLSGVLYLQTSKNCGDLSFMNYDANQFDLNVSEYNLLNGHTFNLMPQDNLLVLFPSTMYHKVETNLSPKTRYSLAFNVMPTGFIGDISSDSQMTLNL